MSILLLLIVPSTDSPLVFLGITYLVPLAVGLLLVRAPAIVHAGGGRYGRAVSQGILAELITFSIGYAVIFPLTFVINTFALTTVPSLVSPYFWWMLSVITTAGLLGQIPLQGFLRSRGFTVWLGRGAGESALTLPTWQQAWWILALALLTMVGILAWTLTTFA
jgi:hypothetical protein